MRFLEHKVPPPLVAVAIFLAMKLAMDHPPWLGVPHAVRIGALATLVLCGAAVAFAGERGFNRAGTTVNPLKPHKATSLVTTGIYRFSRNPMYLGLALVLLGWAAYLSSAWAFAGPILFVAYMNRFQIAPEERALSAKFRESYADYASRVRRWI